MFKMMRKENEKEIVVPAHATAREKKEYENRMECQLSIHVFCLRVCKLISDSKALR